jgi:hypothetical protein
MNNNKTDHRLQEVQQIVKSAEVAQKLRESILRKAIAGEL